MFWLFKFIEVISLTQAYKLLKKGTLLTILGGVKQLDKLTRDNSFNQVDINLQGALTDILSLALNLTKYPTKISCYVAKIFMVQILVLNFNAVNRIVSSKILLPATLLNRSFPFLLWTL